MPMVSDPVKQEIVELVVQRGGPASSPCIPLCNAMKSPKKKAAAVAQCKLVVFIQFCVCAFQRSCSRRGDRAQLPLLHRSRDRLPRLGSNRGNIGLSDIGYTAVVLLNRVGKGIGSLILV
jgi:hypothetical protein